VVVSLDVIPARLKRESTPDLSFLRGSSRNPWGCGWFEVVIPAGLRRESISASGEKSSISIHSRVLARKHDNLVKTYLTSATKVI
jgi:hypothetical protein